MNFFVSLVGFQPSATAVALKTWSLRHQRPDCVYLLSTRQVIAGGQAEKLCEFGHAFANSCEIVPIAAALQASDKLTAPQAAEQLVTKWRDSGAGHFVFYANPGPNYLVAAISRKLPPETFYLHADVENLFICADAKEEIWGREPLYNLGLDALLDLYGLKKSSPEPMSSGMEKLLRKQQVKPLAGAVTGLKFANSESGALDLVYERRGWLFVLQWVDGGDTQKEDVRALQRLSTQLNRLQPVLAIVSGDNYARARARAAGISAFTPQSPWVGAWLAGRTAPVGQAVISDVVTSEVPRDCTGAGGEGPPLVIWMGIDPGATLTSLFTHKPERAWVLYDLSTPRAVEMARRLQETAHTVPVGKIDFVPSNLYGRETRKALRACLPAEAKLKADVSPGSKAQACALARVPSLELWSLSSSRGEAVALDRGVTCPLQAPDLLTQARVRGGALRKHGEDARSWKQARIDFLLLLGRFLAAAIQQHGKSIQLIPLGNIELEDAKISILGDGRACVSFEGQKLLGPLRKGGLWFEDVIAAVFVNAGANEVRVGVEWDWPEEIRKLRRKKPLEHQNEVDVLARFGGRVFAVSCKAGRSKKMTPAKAAAEIVSVAHACLGRFAVPILARPRLGPPPAGGNTPSTGAARLDLAVLFGVPLKETLDRIWAARRGFAEE